MSDNSGVKRKYNKAHKWNVTQVEKWLETKGCITGKGAIVWDRNTDLWAHDEQNKIWYLCEIKVSVEDMLKAVVQIYDTARRFKAMPDYKDNGKGVIVPVFAISNTLYKQRLADYPYEWKSILEIFKKLKIAIWVVEQSTILQLQGPKL